MSVRGFSVSCSVDSVIISVRLIVDEVVVVDGGIAKVTDVVIVASVGFFDFRIPNVLLVQESTKFSGLNTNQTNAEATNYLTCDKHNC